MNLLDRIMAIFRQPGEARVRVPMRAAGVMVNEDSALTHAAVWACIRVISESIAALPWHVYRNDRSGRQRVPTHGAELLLNTQANPDCTAFSLRETLLAHALTWGNGYAEIQRGLDGRAVALYLLAPDRTCLKRDEVGALYYEHDDNMGVQHRLEPGNVFHLHGLGFDGLTGYSPVRMAARTIGMGIAQDAFGAAFYGNGTTFGGLVEMPATLKPDQVEQLEKYLNDQHQGPEKAFRIRIAHSGAKYHALSMPMTDAQFLESRKFAVTDIARWYRVPPHKVADLERSTNNNIEHQSIEFVTDCLMPWAVRMEQEADRKLFGARAQRDTYTKIELNALMRGDAASRAEFYRTMTQIGAMTINEVRALEDLNGIGPAGDEQLVQLNQTTLQKLVDAPAPGAAAPAAPAVPEPAPEPTQNPTNVIRMEALNFMRSRPADGLEQQA